MNRAYSILNIKAVKEDERVIEGIASTPTPDRMGDIVEPMGAQYKLPMPLLWQHDSRAPVGEVEFAKPNKEGIPFRASIQKTDEPGRVKDRLDEAWQSLKLRLVKAVSIGFTINAYEILKEGGWRITDWEWLELSLVTIPANADATITSIKSIDAELLAATGQKQSGSERTVKAGVTASRSTIVVKATEAKPMKTIAERIAEFEATRAAKSAQLEAIQNKSSEEGRTKDAAEREEFNTLKAEIVSIDAELADLRDMEKLNLAKAVPVDPIKIKSVEDGSKARAGNDQRVIVLPKKLAPGIGFTRYVMASAMAKGNPMLALEIFKGRENWMAESPEIVDILKTAVTAGSTSDTTWASPLVNYTILTDEFIEYLRPLTIIGRMPGLTRVPFKVKIPRQTGGATVNWVGEGAPKPLTSLAFDSVTLDFAKIAGIIVINQELARLATPSAELLVRNDLAKSIVQFMDNQFVDPSKAAVSGVSPASITNGVSATIATGTTGAALRSDLKTLLSTFLTANMQVANVVVLMPQRLALAISLMTNSLGQREFPNLTMNGGEILGLPVITSENIPSTGGSPTDGDPIIVVSAPDILLADDGQVSIDASQEASLQMDTAPDSPATASTTFVSLWQQNQIGIRAERYINWAKRRSTAVAYIQNAKYFE